MEITQGSKKQTPVANFFDDDLGATSRELLFDGKRYSDLTSDEQKVAMSAVERKHRDRQGTWAFLVGLGGFCLLLAVHLTAVGMVALAVVVALVCWATAKL